MTKVLKFITDSIQALEAAGQTNVTNVWINGSETFVTISEGTDTASITIPEVVTAIAVEDHEPVKPRRSNRR